MISIWPSAMLKDDQDIWLMHGDINTLFKYSTDSKSLKYIGSIPDSKIIGDYPYCARIIKNEKYIYMIPFWGEKIGKYDILKGHLSYIPIPLLCNKCGPKYSYGYILSNHLFCVPYLAGSELIDINLNNYEVDIISKYRDTVEDNQAKWTQNIVKYVDNKIIGVLGETNKLFTYDFEHKEMEVFCLSDNRIINSCAYVLGELYIQMLGDDNLYKITLSEHTVLINEVIKIGIGEYTLLGDTGSYIIADSLVNGMIAYIKDNHIHRCERTKERIDNLFGPQRFYGVASTYNDRTVYFFRHSGELLDLKSGEISKICINRMDEEKISSLIDMEKSIEIKENIVFDCESFVNSILGDK